MAAISANRGMPARAKVSWCRDAVLGCISAFLGALNIHQCPAQSVGPDKQSRCRLLVFGGAINQCRAFIDLVQVLTKAVFPQPGQRPYFSWIIDPTECAEHWVG